MKKEPVNNYAAPRERAEAEHEALRARILDAAEKILQEEGPDKLSLRGIARRISYAPASLYYYFPNKEAILQGVIARGGRRIGMVIQKAVENVKDPIEAVKAAFRAYIEDSLKRPELVRVVYTIGAAGPDNLKPGATQSNPNLAFLASLISDALKAGKARCSDADLAARSLWVAAQGLALRLVIDGIKAGSERNRLRDSYLDMIIYGICREQTAKRKGAGQ